MHAGPIALFNEAAKLTSYGRQVERVRQQTETESAETRCADCWQRIKRDESHTCKQQVRRNQERAIRRDDTPQEGEQ
jgi:hypothetical protein